MLDSLWYHLLWIGLCALIGTIFWIFLGPRARIPRRLLNPYRNRIHKGSWLLFWPAMALLVLAASASTLVSISAVLFNRLPYDVLDREWSPVWILFTRLAMSMAAVAVLVCVSAASLSDPTAKSGAFRRMVTSISFTMICLLGGGLLFGPAIPSGGDPVRVPPGSITIYTSGSKQVSARVSFGGSYTLTDEDARQPPSTNAGRPSGGIQYSIGFVGQPGSVVSFAIVNAGSAIAEAAVAPDAASFSVSATTNTGRVRGGSMVDGQCVSELPLPQQLDHLSGQLLRGTAVVGVDGRASVKVVARGNNSWFRTGGGRSVVSLPAIQTGPFGDCGAGYEELSGTWTKPERFIVRADVPTDVGLGAVVSARPELSDPPETVEGLDDGLYWDVNEIDTTGRPAEDGDPTGAFLWPRYSIETAETARLAAAALFASGLLAAAALTGVFEIVTSWPTQCPASAKGSNAFLTRRRQIQGARRSRRRDSYRR